MAAYISFQPSDFFNTKLYTGNGSTNAITGVGFQPDFTWIKDRDGGNSPMWTDAVRGSTKVIESSGTAAEATQAAGVTSYDSDGFTLGSYTGMNSNTVDFASWNWKAGTTSGLSGGTITPTGYSINTTSGFGIYLYTGTNVNATIAHGLGVAPKMVIIKRLTSGAGWLVQNTNLTSADYVIKLNETAAESSDSANFNGAFPTSTVFSVGTSNNTNKTGDAHVAYVFAEKQGYSSMGIYKGNGNADGPFIYTGFRPACIIIKISSGSGTGNWYIFDNKRLGYNVDNNFLYPNLTSAEATTDVIDLTSNGFKIRSTEFGINADGKTLIYAAFAEFPFVSSNSKAGTAR